VKRLELLRQPYLQLMQIFEYGPVPPFHGTETDPTEEGDAVLASWKRAAKMVEELDRKLEVLKMTDVWTSPHLQHWTKQRHK